MRSELTHISSTNGAESGKPILFQQEDGVARVTLNRPAVLNALNPEMIVTLAEIWNAIEQDPTIRVVILDAIGGRAFCVGADLGRLIPLLTGAREPEDEWDRRILGDKELVNRALLRTSGFSVPVIVAVDGYALAGGTELVLAADIRVISDESSLGLTEVTRGLIPGGGGLARLSRQVPYTVAAQIALVGERVSAQEALSMGLVTRVVARTALSDEVRRFADRMRDNAPIAMRKAKEALLRCSGRPLAEAFTIEAECTALVIKTKDAQEGPLAFVEKRPPKFIGS